MRFSEDMINAYADGELQGSEKAEFEAALRADFELQCALDEVLQLKRNLREAYLHVDVPTPVQTQTASVKYRVAGYMALFALVFSSGWLSSDFIHKPATVSEQLTLLAPSASSHSVALNKYILHIGSKDNVKFKHALDEAEALLVKNQHNQQSFELEVIANAGGLDLLREGGSPYSARVKQLSKEYPNIRFIACSNAVERLREQGIEANLINTVYQGPTALDQVVLRMSEGWSYVKI